MAVFGLPRGSMRMTRCGPYAPHTKRKRALAALNDELERDFGVRLTNRTGVNTGEVVTGDAATAQRLVTGDTVNTAARLEQAAGPNEVLIGELTWRLVRDAVEVEPIEPLELKGKAERVAAYRLLEVVAGIEGAARDGRQPLVGRDGRARPSSLAQFRDRGRRAEADAWPPSSAMRGSASRGSSARSSPRLRMRRPSSAADACSYGDGTTFWPVIEAVRDAAGISPDDGPEVGLDKLASLVVDPDVVERFASILGLSQRTVQR